MDINKRIEDTRDKLNNLIACKEIITNDQEILEVSVTLDKLLNEYVNYNKLNKQQ